MVKRLQFVGPVPSVRPAPRTTTVSTTVIPQTILRATPTGGDPTTTSGGGGGGGGSFQGPVRPTTDEEVFRATGISVPTGSAQAVAIRLQLQQEEAQRVSEAQQARQETIQAGTIAGQIETQEERSFAGPVRPGTDVEIFRQTGRSVPIGSIEASTIRRGGDGVVSAFDPIASSTILPSRRALGATGSFFGGIAGDVSSFARKFFNAQTAEDLDRQVRGTSGLAVIGTGGILVGAITTGTVIDPGSGIREQVTFEERVQQEAIIGGGAGTPVEFIAQDIGTEVSARGQRNLDTAALTIQGKIDSGDLTLSEGKEQLGEIEKSIETNIGKEFERRLKTDQRIADKLKSEASIDRLRESQNLDLAQPIITGAALVGLATPVTAPFAGAALATLGAEQFITSSGRAALGQGLTFTQRGLEAGRAGLGLVQVGIGVGAGFGSLARQIDTLTISELQQQTGKIVGVERFRGPEGSFLEVRTLRQTDVGKLVTTQKFPLFNIQKEGIFGTTESGQRILLREGEQFFSVTGGKGTSELSFQSFQTDRLVKQTLDFSFFGRGFTSQTAPKLISGPTTTNLESFQGTFGSGGIITREGVTTFPFGGIAQEQGGVLQVVTGQITKGRVGLVDGTTSALFKPSAEGFIIRQDITGAGDVGVRTFFGGGAKTSSLGQVLRQEQLAGVSGLAAASAKESSKLITKNLISSTSFTRNIGAGTASALNIKDVTKQFKRPTTGQVSITSTQLREQTGLGLISGATTFQPQRTGQLPIISTRLESGLIGGLDERLGLGQLQAPRLKLRQTTTPKLKQPLIFPGLTPGQFGFNAPLRTPRFIPPIFGIPVSERAGRRRRTRSRRSPFDIAPSLTGISRFQFGGITGSLPGGKGSFGVLPTQIRLVPLARGTRKAKKKAKKKKKK